MQLTSDPSPEQTARIRALVDGHRTTEQVFQFIDKRQLPYDIWPMDEYTIDIVVHLPNGLHLVYDTT